MAQRRSSVQASTSARSSQATLRVSAEHIGATPIQRKQSMDNFRAASKLPPRLHQIDATRGAKHLWKLHKAGYISEENLNERLEQVKAMLDRWTATNLTRPANIDYTPSELSLFGKF